MKWLGPAAMAALIVGSCSGKSDDALLTDPAPAIEAAVARTAATPSIEGIPAGEYQLDPAHSSLVFSVNHLGFANFTATFDTFSAALTLDPANPGAATLNATIDPQSLDLPSPPDGFKEQILGDMFIDAGKFPEMSFRSTGVALTGPNTADVTGDFTMHGVTRPVTLSMTYNGGYAGHIQEPAARIGFSAQGSLKRSDFGIGVGIPAPGMTMGVFDEVKITIESEFTGPPWKDMPHAVPAPAPN